MNEIQTAIKARSLADIAEVVHKISEHATMSGFQLTVKIGDLTDSAADEVIAHITEIISTNKIAGIEGNITRKSVSKVWSSPPQDPKKPASLQYALESFSAIGADTITLSGGGREVTITGAQLEQLANLPRTEEDE